MSENRDQRNFTLIRLTKKHLYLARSTKSLRNIFADTEKLA